MTVDNTVADDVLDNVPDLDDDGGGGADGHAPFHDALGQTNC